MVQDLRAHDVSPPCSPASWRLVLLTYNHSYAITSEGLQWGTYIPGTSGIQNFTVDIPTDLPSGDYLLRAEHLAVHAASAVGGAQFYMGCAQLSVTGSGAGTPSPTTTIPGQYTADEAGLVLNIYYPIPTSYSAPGISTWPEACISHWPNLVDQTYYGACYNSAYSRPGHHTRTSIDVGKLGTTAENVTVSVDGTGSESSSSDTATASSSVVVVATSATPVVSNVVTASAVAVAAQSATPSSASTCSKKRRSVKGFKA